ncbi:MAG TPA: hypothetical protein VLI43_01770 [Gemmatimonadaceae bacterium]|nr:hypothetical protein [Gemmatimonadaceae bacterium]
MTAPRMHRNQKLTPVIKGRSIAQIAWDGATALLHFDDGSVMRIHTPAPPPKNAPPATLGKVRAVRQSTEAIAFDLESGATLQIPLAEATSCVMLRNAKGALEYAD